MSSKPEPALGATQKKHFRTIGHQLNPVVTIGDKGLNENIEKELNRALEDHELIKVKLPAGNKAFKTELIQTICAATASEEVQQIGKIVLLYRAARKPSPKLSNLLRFSGKKTD